MKKIFLNTKRERSLKGLYVLVDDEDFEKLSQSNWYYHPDGYAWRAYYPDGRRGKRVTVFMHRIVNNTPDEYITDHINHNGLDNRRSNLRTVNHSLNRLNSRASKSSKSGYKGIWWNAKRRKWEMYLMVEGKAYFKRFIELQDAIVYRKELEKKLVDYNIFA